MIITQIWMASETVVLYCSIMYITSSFQWYFSDTEASEDCVRFLDVMWWKHQQGWQPRPPGIPFCYLGLLNSWREFPRISEILMGITHNLYEFCFLIFFIVDYDILFFNLTLCHVHDCMIGLSPSEQNLVDVLCRAAFNSSVILGFSWSLW